MITNADVTVYNRISGDSTHYDTWIRTVLHGVHVHVDHKTAVLLQWYLDQIPDDIEAAIYALGDFLMCKRMYQDDLEDEEEEQQKSGKPVFSFSEDAGCIYAAFREAYGIDLQQIDYMHWWEFRSLFDWLPDSTEIKQRIMYRSIDPGTIRDKDERKRIKKIQRAVALKKKQRKLDDYEIGDMFS